MIEQYFFNETKQKYSNDSNNDRVYEHIARYEKQIKEDIKHAKAERQKTLDEIYSILELCNDSELERLLVEIYGLINELESLAFYGR